MVQDINPADFRVPASDTQGHSERYWARVQPMMARQVSVVLQSRMFPYRSQGDIWRHALHRHLKWLETLAPLPSIMKQVDAMLEVLREDEFGADFQDVLSKLNGQVNQHIGKGRFVQARELIAKVRARVDEMPDDSHWKAVYLEEIEERFGAYLAGARAQIT